MVTRYDVISSGAGSLAILKCVLILGKIQDGHHLGWRHVPQPIIYTSFFRNIVTKQNPKERGVPQPPPLSQGGEVTLLVRPRV